MAYDKSTWREQRVRVKPNNPVAIYFNDTKPNHILFSNPSPHQLFVSVSSSLSDTTFDMIVPAYGTRLYPRELGLREIYVYHNGSTEFTMNLTSWVGEFNPSSINQSQEIVSGSASGLLGVVDIGHLLNALPSGANKIGRVDVETFPSLPTGNNKIGKVDLETIPPLPAGTNKIGSVDVDHTSIVTELQALKTLLQGIKTYPFTIKTFGLSTDVKPAEPVVGDTFLEIDTKKVHIWNGTAWVVW